MAKATHTALIELAAGKNLMVRESVARKGATLTQE
jgi:hypothetical protein